MSTQKLGYTPAHIIAGQVDKKPKQSHSEDPNGVKASTASPTLVKMAMGCVLGASSTDKVIAETMQVYLQEREWRCRDGGNWSVKALVKENESPVIRELTIGTHYYYIDSSDRVTPTQWRANSYDDERARAHNIYMSQRLAEATRDLLKQIRMRLNHVLFGNLGDRQ